MKVVQIQAATPFGKVAVEVIEASSVLIFCLEIFLVDKTLTLGRKLNKGLRTAFFVFISEFK